MSIRDNNCWQGLSVSLMNHSSYLIVIIGAVGAILDADVRRQLCQQLFQELVLIGPLKGSRCDISLQSFGSKLERLK